MLQDSGSDGEEFGHEHVCSHEDRIANAIALMLAIFLMKSGGRIKRGCGRRF